MYAFTFITLRDIRATWVVIELISGDENMVKDEFKQLRPAEYCGI